MKKFGIIILCVAMTLGMAVITRADDKDFRGELSGSFGSQTLIQGNYEFNDWCKLTGAYKNFYLTTEYFNMAQVGMELRPFDWLGLKGGAGYDFESQEAYPYGGIDLLGNLGAYLKWAGSYTYNIEGKDLARYEAALRIQLYDDPVKMLVYAGVRGDVVPASLSDSAINKFYPYKEAMLFLRPDFTAEWHKFTFELQPILYVQGYWLHNYTVKYQAAEAVSLNLNVNDIYDKTLKYQAGVEWRF